MERSRILYQSRSLSFIFLYPLFAQVCLLHLVVIHQFFCIAAERNVPCLKHIRLIRNGQGLLGILLHQEHGSAVPVNLLDDIKYLIHIDRGKAHGRLIHDNHPGMAHKRPSHGKHLLLAAGQGSCGLVLTLLQAREAAVHHLKGCFHLFLILPGVSPHLQVLKHGEGCEHTSSLWHMGDSHAHQLISGNLGYIRTFINNLTGFCINQPGNGMQGCCLTCPVGPDQRHDFSLVHIKGDSFYGLDHAVIDFQVPDFKHSHTIPLLLFTKICFDNFRIVKHGAGRSLAQYLAEVQHGQFLTDAAYQLHVMFNKKDCHIKIIAYKADGVHKLRCLIGIHARCRFI
ncbi:hypothetical protein CBFG_05369 [Clostridiales bacterium 1_7_47FAA]|nr:hypothetical protein CBFG_05369 [Clostridiales bacterium 1_7_47FAA]